MSKELRFIEKYTNEEVSRLNEIMLASMVIIGAVIWYLLGF